MSRLGILFLGRSVLLRVLCVTLLVCIFVFLHGNFTGQTIPRTFINYFSIDNWDNRKYNRSRFTNNKASLNDETLACVFSKVDPYEPSVMKVAGLDAKPVQCEGNFLPDLTYIQDYLLIINASKVNRYIGNSTFKHCRYRHIYRHKASDKICSFSDWEPPFTDKTKLPSNVEFIQVECSNNKSEIISKSYYPFIPQKAELDEIDSVNLKKRQIESNPKETLNIFMVGLDTVSRYQFLRIFNKTYSFLMNNMTSIDLSMHTQVGRNTFSNLVPLLMGRSEEEVFKWWKESQLVDPFDVVSRTFEKAGYRTFFNEDTVNGGTFYYLKKGFHSPYANYNIRPLAVAAYEDKGFWNHDDFCLGNQLQFQFHLDYSNQFVRAFSDKPVFGLTFLSIITHDSLSKSQFMDKYILEFYRPLKESGFLNKTLLITFSDHGPRYGAIRDSINGDFEGRTPLTILTFPEWFLEKYPDVAENLKVNTKRLTTHFDTHATLLDLLYFKSDNPPPLPPLKHGISLFKKIPSNRTCQDASIPNDFCVCGRKEIEEISIGSELAENLTKMVLHTLNSKRDPKMCAIFKVRNVIRIIKIVIKEFTSEEQLLYKVKLQTTPGDGIYEGNVYKKNLTSWNVGNEIDRFNLYGSQADCIESAIGRLFCYCKNLL